MHERPADPSVAPAAPLPAAAPPRPRRGRRLLVVLMLVPLLVLGAALAVISWCANSETGTAWLLERVPGLRVSGTKGALLGDFEAGRVELALPRDGRLTIDGLAWRGLSVRWTGGTPPVIVLIERLAATRLEFDPGTPDPKAAPLRAPDALTLPVELRIESLQLQALHTAALGDTPLRELKARLHLGADDGREHRIEQLALAYGRLRASGSATLGSGAPLAVMAQVDLTQDTPLANAQWSAAARLAGTLTLLDLQATLRAAPVGRNAPQSLELRSSLRPFAPWPLGELDAVASNLDLSGFHADAPVTSLSGSARARSEALDRPARVELALRNDAAGRWNEGRLPVQQLKLGLRARPDDPGTLTLDEIAAELGAPRLPAGTLAGRGRWASDGWRLEATLTDLVPAGLDARAAPMRLSGPLTLSGSAPGAPGLLLALQATLDGQLAQRGPARAVRLQLDAEARRDEQGAERVELRELHASAGQARATLTGRAQRAGPAAGWQLTGKTTLAQFDPLPWWPGRDDSPWRRGPHRLNANGSFDLQLPAPAPGRPDEDWSDRLAALRGNAALTLADSQLAGVPLRGRAKFATTPAGGAAQLDVEALADGNRLRAGGRVNLRTGQADRWELELDAPALARLTPVWRLLRADAPDAALAGTLNARAQVAGRWPVFSSSGQAEANGLRIDTSVTLERASARWRASSTLDAPLEASAEVSRLTIGPARFDTAKLQLAGNGRAHRLELRAESAARPPAWVDTLQGAAPVAGPSVALLQAQGGLLANGAALAGWRGRIEQVDLRAAGAGQAWLRSADLAVEVLGLDVAPLRVALAPGRAEVAGAALRWERIAWRAGVGSAPAEFEGRAALEPLAVAPLLKRLQPEFGWGGDLALAGRLELRSSPTVAADIVLERARGDLTVTDEVGTQALGLSDLRLGLNVADGVWSFTQGMAGSTIGVAAGAFVARTTPQARWPAPDTPVSGVLELQVANLGTWGTWVPAGWRLGGTLRVSAGIAGRFGAPEYTGQMQGRGISVRNFLQGVNISDGEVAVALQGDSARIERFSARAGNGTLTLAGGATLGATPRAEVTLDAQHFQLLGRVDRRIVASGQARLALDRDKMALEGRFKVDEGLVDFTRSDAPALSDDVSVMRAPRVEATRAAERAAGEPQVVMPRTELDLRVDLGEQLRLRGRGLQTGLRGELRLTTSNGKLALNGSVRTEGGTYAAYGQKLEIERGELTFNGPVDDPRLDIEATRPNLDVRVGVAVSGPTSNPRVRLFSEPELSDMDKLSWLMLGRASDGLGGTDVALLQRAALALLAGDTEGPADQLIRAIGLDELSVRQNENGGSVRETVVSLGKQLSRHWYVGYERSLNATTGSWQLIYRIAQRFTIRAQSGEDSSLDVIWTWRWN